MPDKVYQVLNSGINAGVLMSNTMNIRATAGAALTAANLNAAIAQIRVFYAALAAYNPSTQVWTAGTRVLELDSANPALPPVIMGCTPAAVVAGTGGVQTINQACLCIAWRTGTAGRSYRGRTFFGALAASVVAGGVVGSGIVTAVNNAANALITNLFALTPSCHLTVYSRKVGVCTDITSGVTDSLPDVLRSRKR